MNFLFINFFFRGLFLTSGNQIIERFNGFLFSRALNNFNIINLSEGYSVLSRGLKDVRN